MAEAEHVVVLHGLGLNRYWMAGLAASLRRRGYVVHNVSYPSLRKDFAQLVDGHLAPLLASIPAAKVHVVAHSMGGLLVRLYAQKYGAARLGRVVMLGTPNHGSEVADFLARWRLLHFFLGAAGRELGTDSGGIAARLGPVPFDCGVIAGYNRWFHFPTSFIVRALPRRNDGIVAVESTKVPGMKDHLVLWLDHSLMVWSRRVWQQAAHFLGTGAFRR